MSSIDSGSQGGVGQQFGYGGSGAGQDGAAAARPRSRSLDSWRSSSSVTPSLPDPEVRHAMQSVQHSLSRLMRADPLVDGDLKLLSRDTQISVFESTLMNKVEHDTSIQADMKDSVVAEILRVFQTHGIDTKDATLNLNSELQAIRDLIVAADDGINNAQRTKTFFQRQYGHKWYEQLISLLNVYGKAPAQIIANTAPADLAFVNKPFMDLMQAIDVMDDSLTSFDVRDVEIDGEVFTEEQLLKLKRIPRNINCLTNLTDLDFHGTSLTHVSHHLFDLENLTVLHLQDNQIQYLPNEVGNLVNLLGLNLSGNALTQLPESLSQLTQLKDLTLASNQLRELPDSLTALGSLERLIVSHNQLTELPATIGTLRALDALEVAHNQLSKLPKSLFSIQTLAHLDVSHNQLKYMREEIGKLTALETLKWSHNGLDGLPTTIRFLIKLKTIDLCHNALREITDHFAHMGALKTANLAHNKIEKLPNAFGNMTHLEELHLTDNSLTALPAGLKDFVNLRIFNADHNRIDPILALAFSGVGTAALQLNVGKQIFVQTPNYVEICKVLAALGVDMAAERHAIKDMRDHAHVSTVGTQSTTKKEGIAHFDYQYGEALDKTDLEKQKAFEKQLVNLAREFGGRLATQINADRTITKAFVTRRFVDLRQEWTTAQTMPITLNTETFLYRLPSNISNSPNLSGLSVTGSALESLPSSIGTLSALADLNVSRNKIQSLPLALTACDALTSLNVASNQLSVLPAMLSNLSQLASLLVARNQLSALPRELCTLAQLQTLNASHNRIAALPTELGQMTALTVLNVEHNQLAAFPDSILRLAALSVLDATNNQVKSLPVGFGAAFPALTTLKMKNNLLRSLPVDIGRLAALQVLDLENHRVKTWQPGMRTLANLTTVTTKTVSPDPKVTRIDPDLRGSPAVNLVSNLTGAGRNMTAEYAALKTMRNSAAGDGVDPRDANKYFKWQYGATAAEQYRALSDEFPGQTMQQIQADPSIEKAFVTTRFKAEWDKIAFGITGTYQVRDKGLYRIPSNLATQTGVTRINLAGSNIRTIPAFVTRMTQLTSLNMQDNDLRSVPAALANLTNLTLLFLENNQLTTLPNLRALTNLTTFGAANNQLTQFPAWLAAHSTVQKVWMGGNNLSALGVILNLTGMTALNELHLDKCALTAVPANLPASLTTLSLRGNQFNPTKFIDVSVLPVSLQKLNLSFNKTGLASVASKSLNVDFSCLTNLTDLNLSSCDLSYTSLGFKLPNFNVSVDFQHNDFYYYPEMRKPKPGASGTGHYVRADISDPQVKQKLMMGNNNNLNRFSTFRRWIYN